VLFENYSRLDVDTLMARLIEARKKFLPEDYMCSDLESYQRQRKSNRLRREIVSRGEVAVDYLVDALARSSTIGVAHMQDEVALRDKHLPATLNGRYWVRREAARLLGSIGDPGATLPLLNAMRNDGNDMVEYAAASALDRMGTPEVRAAVRQWRRDKGDEIIKIGRAKFGEYFAYATDPELVERVGEMVAHLRALGHVPGRWTTPRHVFFAFEIVYVWWGWGSPYRGMMRDLYLSLAADMLTCLDELYLQQDEGIAPLVPLRPGDQLLPDRRDLSRPSLAYRDLRGTDLSGKSIQYAQLPGASLCGADLRGTGLCWVMLYKTDLREANLQEADLRGAVLFRANLQGASVDNAQFDEFTILPDGSPWTPNADVARFTDPDHPAFYGVS
jgi:hypothetical protein